MPEGPEVEQVRRELLLLEGQVVQQAQLTPLALKYQRYVEQEEKIGLLRGRTLTKVERRGKYLVWWFGPDPDNLKVMNHLGMTGAWHVSGQKNEELPSHSKVVLDFASGTRAIFDDVRNFGRFVVYRSAEEMMTRCEALRKLGIDGLAVPFPQAEFEDLLAIPRNQTKTLGEVLLDQRLVAGVGNIYKSEALFRARLHPETIVSELGRQEMKSLGKAVSEVLCQALESGGSTISNFQSPTGVEGKAQEWHQVYAREDRPCLVCGTPVERLVQRDRSTFYCPTCQPRKKGGRGTKRQESAKKTTQKGRVGRRQRR